MNKIALIVFDCDGVLIDSEFLGNQYKSKLLTEHGYSISPDEVSRRFSGLRSKTILKEIEKEVTIPFSAKLLDSLDSLFKESFDLIKPIQNIQSVLKKIDLPKAVASNASSQSLNRILNITNLSPFFEPYIYSALSCGTKRLKPAPDIYLYVADQLKCLPSETIVVEDSVVGVQSATSAGMRVIGFTGGSHTYLGHSEALMKAGAETVISNHKDLPLTIKAFETWKLS